MTPEQTRRDRHHSWRRDLAVYGVFLATALWVTGRHWADPAGRVARVYSDDPAQVQFFLAHSVRVVLHGDNPFFTQQLNHPDGVNLMANTAILGLGIPMVPVTLLFGPAVSFVVLVTVGLAATASAWYFVLDRHVVSAWPAAVVGGWFCGFSPAMLSHANWHPNIISQFLIPFIVWRVIALTRPGRTVREGAILAALVCYQVFINEEILLFTAMAVGVFLIAMLVQRPGRWAAAWRPLAGGLAVCAALAGAVLAYPLYVQFAGPQAYHGLSEAVRDYGNDLAAFVNPGSPTIGGTEWANANLAPNFSEENAFFGWGLALLAIAIVGWLWRDAVVRALAATGIVFAVLSLGERISLRERELVTGPWEWLVRLPLLDAVVPTRFGLITTVVVGLLLAIGTDRAWALRVPDRRALRTVIVVALAITLVPIAPMPLKVVPRPPVPQFISSGAWREYVPPDRTLVPVPIPAMHHTDGMRWAAVEDLGFAIPGGYFLAPRDGVTGNPGQFGTEPTEIGVLLEKAAMVGQVPTLNQAQRAQAVADLRRWRAAILVLPVREFNSDPLRRMLEQVAGRPERVSDVWLWDVRELVDESA